MIKLKMIQMIRICHPGEQERARKPPRTALLTCQREGRGDHHDHHDDDDDDGNENDGDDDENSNVGGDYKGNGFEVDIAFDEPHHI